MDGKPVPNEFINFVRKTDPGRNYNPDNTKTSENGEFSIKLVKGSRDIFGSFITFSGSMKVSKLEKRSRQAVACLRLNPGGRVDPVTDVSGIELRFPSHRVSGRDRLMVAGR